MTTNRDSVTILGELIATWIDQVEDDQVIDTAKAFIHDTLEEGLGIEAPATTRESLVWELVDSLGFTPITNVWKVQSAIFQLVDSYDLFND